MPDTQPLDEVTQKRLVAFLRQAQNAGFDFDTIEGQNTYRATLEFSRKQQQRCEDARGQLTKYGLAMICIAVTTTLVTGFWAQVVAAINGVK
jgi:hypothetical protein